MDSTKIKPEVSAEIPVLSSTVKHMVERLDEGACYDEMWEEIKKLVKEWEGQSLIPHARIVNLMHEGDTYEYKNFRVVLHAIPRKVFRSLLLGMMPYDLYDRDHPNWANIYDARGPGAYLVGLSIEGRRGAFLNREEIEAVIVHMRDYKAGCEAWLKMEGIYDDDDLTDAEEECLRKALAMDNNMAQGREEGEEEEEEEGEEEEEEEEDGDEEEWDEGEDALQQPKCMSSRKTIANIEALIEMLGRRVNPALDGKVFQLSSPVYVGCGTVLTRRMIQHNPSYHNMVTSSNALKLLISCIRYMGLKPIVHEIPVVMVWEPKQVQLAEILVTVLSQSLISLSGLNVVQPGTSKVSENTPADLYAETEIHVVAKRPWFGENCKKTLDKRNGVDIMEETFALLKREFPSLEEHRKQQEEIIKNREETERIWAMLPAAMEAARERIKFHEGINARLDKLVDASLLLFPSLRQECAEELRWIAEYRAAKAAKAEEAAKAHEGDKGKEGHGRDQDQEIADSQEQEPI
ncbi:hypothetical protein F4774DRAFT_424774 [Daldinia eschscholtzii]|nr:hypothetical protein F4774DRAFT_424774 [Daldinia eschscholtzii]